MNATIGQIHELVDEEVFEMLRSRPEGLTDSEVAARRREVGPNCLQSSPRLQRLRLLIKQFVNLFSILLDIAAAVCFVADSIQPSEGMGLLGWALLGVSVLNAVFAFAQEMRAERAMEELRKFLPQTVHVRREGLEIQVLADELVPGDVLLVGEGDRIAADARLIESEDLLVNNAPLTGEGRSQSLIAGARKGRLVESPNIVFAGCSVLRGNGVSVVFATGHRTEFGRIAAVSRDVRRPLSPLQRETDRLVRLLTLIAVSLGVLADVGIAMGASGTEVARDAADIVLLDDNFASIVAGVEEGRTVFANMQKFTTYVLASNIPEMIPFLIYIVLPVPLGLTVIQILTIDLGTDLLPAIGLRQEPPEGDTMRQPPRRLDQRLLSLSLMATAYLFLGMIQAAFSMFLFFLVLHNGGWKWGQELSENDPLYRSATGITLATIILMQIGNLAGRRSLRGSGLDRGLLRNRMLLVGVAVEIVFSWAILYYVPVQELLRTGPVAWHFYALAWLGIPLLFILDFIRKRVLTMRTMDFKPLNLP